MTGIIIIFTSCLNSPDKESVVPLKIEVYHPEKGEKGLAEMYFDNLDCIPLETNSKSVIGKIARISFHNELIFILDESQKQILIFNSLGKYLDKLGKKGRGPGEYVSIRDFSINRSSGDILLLCDTPNKIIVFNERREFLREFKLKKQYRAINITNDIIWLFPEEGDYYVEEVDFLTGGLSEIWLRKKPLSIQYPYIGSGFPIVVSGRETYLYAPLDNIIYNISNTGAHPKYYIDFKEHNIPNDFIKLNIPSSNIYSYCKNKSYGFFISNFKETTNYVFFTYPPSYVVIYEKKIGKSKVYDGSIYDENNQIYLSSFFSHDGDDSSIINVIEPQFYIKGAKYIAEHARNKNVANVFDSLDATDNPVLLRYTFKE